MSHLEQTKAKEFIQVLTAKDQVICMVRAEKFFGAALKCAPIMEWEFILASGRSSF